MGSGVPAETSRVFFVLLAASDDPELSFVDAFLFSALFWFLRALEFGPLSVGGWDDL